MGQGIMLSASQEIDFMIHGVFSYELFGQTVWITTTHVCVLIVMLVIIGFSIAAGRAVKHASDVPGTFQNIAEMVVEMLDNIIPCPILSPPYTKILIFFKITVFPKSFPRINRYILNTFAFSLFIHGFI